MDQAPTSGRAQALSGYRWLFLGALSVLTIYLYGFMEWLFFATKRSFMDYLPGLTKAGILLLPGLALSIPALAAVAALYALSRALHRADAPLLAAGALVPGLFLAFTALLMIDNFTYTVLRFGIVSAQGIGRGVYALLFTGLLAAAWVWSWRKARAARPAARRWASAPGVALALLLISMPLTALLYRENASSTAVNSAGAPRQTPNILLIGTDGLDASLTSIYGGQPDTTPYLRELAGESLLALNYYQNANITSGSLVAMFTSKLPTQTRMLYPPDILTGLDAFQHLPGILKNAGYYNAEISVDYYADPEMLNLQDGFVMVNGRSATVGRLYTTSRRYLPESAAYFLSVMAKRLTDRLMHITYLREMPNPYQQVTTQLSTMTDDDRLGMVISLFRDIRQPLFIHAHLMGTHTTDPEELKPAVANFDRLMRDLLAELEAMGRLEDTVVIVYTDHGSGNTSNVRLPLMFRFPGGERAGKIHGPTSSLDVAPTVLDYLGVQPPAWMSGHSLLRGEPPAGRPVFSVAPSYRVDIGERMQLDVSKIKPPFYQFGLVNMIVCGRWYAVDTTTRAWNEGEVAGAIDPCAAGGSPPETRQAQRMLLDQLREDGFDVSTLESAFQQGN